MPEVLLTMPPGTKVRVTLEDGTRVTTVITSRPWMLLSGHWVVKSEATGDDGYNLARFEIYDTRIHGRPHDEEKT